MLSTSCPALTHCIMVTQLKIKSINIIGRFYVADEHHSPPSSHLESHHLQPQDWWHTSLSPSILLYTCNKHHTCCPVHTLQMKITIRIKWSLCQQLPLHHSFVMWMSRNALMPPPQPQWQHFLPWAWMNPCIRWQSGKCYVPITCDRPRMTHEHKRSTYLAHLSMNCWEWTCDDISHTGR